MDFFQAMATDDGPSATGDIGRRLGAKTNLVANYRHGCWQPDSWKRPGTE